MIVSPNPLALLSASYAAVYIIAAILIKTKDALTALIACILCQVFCSSIVYSMVSGYDLHLSYSIVYFVAASTIKSQKAKIACFIMAAFNVLMAKDAYDFPTTQTWLYLNYEFITALLHALVISACIEWREVWLRANDCFNNLRHGGRVLFSNMHTRQHQSDKSCQGNQKGDFNK